MRSQLPKGDGTQLVGAAAAVRSTCRAGMCDQPGHPAGQGWDPAGERGLCHGWERGVAK